MSTITALLGLFSAAIVVGGGSSVGDLSAAERAIVFFAALVVYSVAFLAVVIGAGATFGGLGVRQPTVRELTKYRGSETGKGTDAGEVAKSYRKAAEADPWHAAVHRELASAAEQQGRVHRHQIELAQARMDQLVRASNDRLKSVPRELKLLVGAKRTAALGWRGLWGSNPSDGDAFDYRLRYEYQADKRRARLHKSRFFGITAALLSGVLAMTLLGPQTLNRSTPALSVLVVHNGTVSCETTHGSATGPTTFTEATTGVTQVTVVPHC